MPSLLILIRPQQWTKSLFVLAPLFFALQFHEIEAWYAMGIAVICFITISGVVYIVNDINDINEDRAHPRKKQRPLASGKVSLRQALLFAGLLFLITAGLLTILPIYCTIIVGTYALIQIAYTLRLKHVAVVDVLIIASGFVLRVLMGAYAIDVPVSPWIIATTYLLALFLGFGKRYHEYSIEGYATKRVSLNGYSKHLLEQLISISCVCALLSYTIYAIETARLLDKTALVYTVIFVIFGLFRYLQALYIDQKGGEPEKILLTDIPFIINGLVWAIITVGVLAL